MTLSTLSWVGENLLDYTRASLKERVAKTPKETLDQEGKEAGKSIHGSSYGA